MEFFNGQRRRVTFVDWAPKHNTEDEKRMLMKFSIVLAGQSITGFPEFINDAFVAIEKQGNPITSIELETEVEGVTLEFYDTDTSRKRIRVISAATIRKFSLERRNGETFIQFSSTVPRPLDVYEFLHVYESKDVFIQFDATQAKLVFPGDEEKQDKLFDKAAPVEEEDEEEKEVRKVAKNFGVEKAAKKR